MITPKRAAVRPRVKRVGGDVAYLLEDEIAELAKAGGCGVLVLRGGSGSGKSSALRHLAAVLSPRLAVQLVDRMDDDDELHGGMASLILADHTLVVTTVSLPGMKTEAELQLAPWGQDEWIEYLLARHPDQCKSVMTRLLASEETCRANYSAEIWSVVFEEMAADETIDSPLDAMICRLSRRFTREQQLAMSPLVLRCLRTTQFVPWLHAVNVLPDIDCPSWRLLNQPLVSSWIAAAYAANRLKQGEQSDDECCLENIERLPRSYLYNLAVLARGDEEITSQLSRITRSNARKCHAAAVSILHLAGVLAPPAAGSRPNLVGAILEGVQWPRVMLSSMELYSADFSGANLFQVNLDFARAWRADFSNADLREASVHRANLRGAMLLGADFSSAKAVEVDLAGADCRDARFNDADLRRAKFATANLTGASFSGACLSGASLRHAEIEGADFTGADLSRAALDGLHLAAAVFRDAKFVDASCRRCDLEGIELLRTNCEGADFSNASFTAASLPGANLQDANFRGCGLADVNWEDADLRYADLRGAVFSMGGSRSGLVGSPFPGHGTRTGFYTDDFNDLSTHKHPEEIRKANLCGADLRGADIEGVDFYLVDLRGALYDPDQAEQLRRCGAILREPVA